MSESERPTFARLLDWLEGNLPEHEAEAVARQVAAADEETKADVAWIRSFLRASGSIRVGRPPSAVRDVLRRRFEAYAETKRPPGVFERLVARLTFDSNLQAATTGVRSAATEGLQRQFIFATDVAEIAVNVRASEHGRRLDVLGQVFPSTDVALDEFVVQLLHGGEEVVLTGVDELGEFTFSAVPSGEYEIVVSSDRFEIILKPVHLQL